MSSSYTYPETSVFYVLHDDQIGLVTTDTDDVDTSFTSIDETVTDGLWIDYEGDPILLDPDDPDVGEAMPPVNPRIHEALVKYVLSQLYLYAAKDNPEYLALSERLYGLFAQAIKERNGGKPRPNIRVTIPRGPGAIR